MRAAGKETTNALEDVLVQAVKRQQVKLIFANPDIREQLLKRGATSLVTGREQRRLI